MKTFFKKIRAQRKYEFISSGLLYQIIPIYIIFLHSFIVVFYFYNIEVAISILNSFENALREFLSPLNIEGTTISPTLTLFERYYTPSIEFLYTSQVYIIDYSYKTIVFSVNKVGELVYLSISEMVVSIYVNLTTFQSGLMSGVSFLKDQGVGFITTIPKIIYGTGDIIFNYLSHFKRLGEGFISEVLKMVYITGDRVYNSMCYLQRQGEEFIRVGSEMIYMTGDILYNSMCYLQSQGEGFISMGSKIFKLTGGLIFNLLYHLQSQGDMFIKSSTYLLNLTYSFISLFYVSIQFNIYYEILIRTLNYILDPLWIIIFPDFGNFTGFITARIYNCFAFILSLPYFEGGQTLTLPPGLLTFIINFLLGYCTYDFGGEGLGNLGGVGGLIPNPGGDVGGVINNGVFQINIRPATLPLIFITLFATQIIIPLSPFAGVVSLIGIWTASLGFNINNDTIMAVVTGIPNLLMDIPRAITYIPHMLIELPSTIIEVSRSLIFRIHEMDQIGGIPNNRQLYTSPFHIIDTSHNMTTIVSRVVNHMEATNTTFSNNSPIMDLVTQQIRDKNITFRNNSPIMDLVTQQMRDKNISFC